ncbi:MAG: hypothetical protein ABI863_01255, partial [Ginsengibacter sp.]
LCKFIQTIIMGATYTFLYVLTAVLLLPLIPAFLLYKFLPSRTNVSGPFKGLNLKLTGAFGGYFLLVLTAVGIFFPLLKNDQAKIIEQQDAKIKQLENTISDRQQWIMKGNIVSTSPKQTKAFFDESGTSFYETGEFAMNFYAELQQGKPVLPKALCIYNKDDGYKVLNISRDFKSDDIKNFGIVFDDSAHMIKIDSAIDIQSKAKAIIDAENNLLNKIRTNQVNISTYKPEQAVRLIKSGVMPDLKKDLK